jgi:hypothetical protein
MGIEILLPFLTFGTLFAVAILGFASAQRTEARRKDPDARKPSLAADQSSHARPTDV